MGEKIPLYASYSWQGLSDGVNSKRYSFKVARTSE